MLLPFFAMLKLSFSPDSEIFAYPPRLLPKALTMKNYLDVFSAIPLAKYFF